MVKAPNFTIATLILLAASASPIAAQNRAPGRVSYGEGMMPAQRTFANSYLAAITGPDIERYLRLLHPRTKSCMTPDNAEFFNSIFARRVGRVARHPRLSVEKVKDATLLSTARTNGLSYPTRPTHTLRIDLVSGGSRQSAIIAYAAREAGIWYEVLPCPSARAIEMVRETKQRDALETIRARALADSLQEPLRTELLTLLTDSGSVVATRRYSEIMQLDLSLARRVVKALEQDLTLVH